MNLIIFIKVELYTYYFMMLDFACIIRDEVGNTTSEILHLPAVEDDPQRRRPDISKAIEELGWEPRVPLQKGLQTSIKYFKYVNNIF